MAVEGGGAVSWGDGGAGSEAGLVGGAVEDGAGAWLARVDSDLVGFWG